MESDAIGKQLRAIRVAAGVTYRDLQAAGIAPHTISELERGATNASLLKYIQALEQKAGITVEVKVMARAQTSG
jgi:transcriptional regulator with XRE-family HTH domain